VAHLTLAVVSRSDIKSALPQINLPRLLG
jgi:hypothetical protein